jgi:uncharacterized membrane protein
MGQMGGVASLEIPAPIAVVYAICEDVETAPTWQKGLDQIEAVDRDTAGRPTLAKSTTDAGVTKITTTVRFSYETHAVVRWEQVKGDLKSLVGAWELEDLGGERTHATYRLEGDTGRMLGMLVRGPVEAKLRDILVNRRPHELAERVARG